MVGVFDIVVHVDLVTGVMVLAILIYPMPVCWGERGHLFQSYWSVPSAALKTLSGTVWLT